MTDKIKIGIWVLSDYKPQAGGGFFIYDKIIHMIDNFDFPDHVEVCFVGHKPASEYKFKKDYVCVYPFPLNVSFISDKVTRVSHKLKFIGKREGRILNRNNVDLIYYPVQGLKRVNNFPFVAANWDIGHKATFAFPEFASNYTFDYREKWYSKEIYKALMIFAESVAGKKELIDYTKLNPERIGIVPLFPGGITELNVDEADQSNFLEQAGLVPGKFYFYPAQFWAHKNHYNLLLAFREVLKEFPDMKLVLAGSDKGNKNYIVDSADKLGISKNVLFTGFISNEFLYTLYKKASALVFAGLAGPTNMPLIEGGFLNCPVLCTDLVGHREQLKDGALYFNGLDPMAISEKMKYILIEENRRELLAKADEIMKHSFFTAENAMKSLAENFSKLRNIRNTWGESDKIF